jgi:hypothetical protein
MNQFSCPKCGYQHTSSLRLLYERGKQTTTGVGVGAGIDGGVGVGVGASVISSEFLRRISPPKKHDQDTAPVLLFFFFIVLGLCASAIHLLVGIGVGGYGFYLALQTARSAADFNKNELPALQKFWETQFCCTRCGEIFVPAKP